MGASFITNYIAIGYMVPLGDWRGEVSGGVGTWRALFSEARTSITAFELGGFLTVGKGSTIL